MIKRLLFGVLAFAFVGAANAQTVQLKQGRKLANNSSKFFQNRIPTVKSQLSSEQAKATMWVGPSRSAVQAGVPMKADGTGKETRWFSYRNSDYFRPASLNEISTYHVCSLVPYGYAGATVDSVSIIFGTKDKIKNLKVWFSAVVLQDDSYLIPTSPEAADYSFDVDVATIEGSSITPGTNALNIAIDTLALPQPYKIPEGGCFVGYSFTYTGGNAEEDGDIALVFVGTDALNGGYYYVPSGDYQGWQGLYGTGYGNLSTAVLCDVTGLESHDVAIGGALEASGVVGKPAAMSFAVMNNGFNPVNEISYVVDVNDTKSAEQTFKFDTPLPSYETATITLPATATKAGQNTVTATITKVDGLENISEESSTSGTMYAVATPYERKSVVEILLSNGDGSSPITYAGVDRMKKDFGDKVIPLMAHFSISNGSAVIVDPMQEESYLEVANTFGFNLGDAIFNRMQTGDAYMGVNYPYTEDEDGVHMLYGSTETIHMLDSLYPAEGKVTLDAYYSNLAKSEITAEVLYEFGVTRLDPNYALAFVLTEDGQAGTDTTWLQSNYFSKEYTDMYYQIYNQEFTLLDPYKNADTEPWVSKPAVVTMPYDDVIVHIWSGTSGIDNSISNNIVANRERNYTTTFDISTFKNIQNKEALKLAVLLINRNNGTIVNADQIALGSGAVGIDDVESAGAARTEVARYSVNGVKLDAPQKGLNIIKYSDGTVQKVIVK